MNPRQRRGIILLGLSVVGAVAVFVSVASFVNQVRAEVGPTIAVLQLTSAATAFEPVTEDMVTAVEIPERWAPDTVMTDPTQLLGVVAGVDLPGGVLLQEGMLVARPAIEPGQREIAILVDAETGVAGKIGPGSVVDIYATFPGDQETPPQSVIVVQDAAIVDVDVPTTKPSRDGTFAEQSVVPVTFAVSVAESLQIAYVESFGQEVRLALRSPTDRDELSPDERRYQPEFGSAFPTGPSPAGEPPGGQREDGPAGPREDDGS